MTRWTSLKPSAEAAAERWGNIVVGDTEVSIIEKTSPLTDNMYGDTTPTHDLLLTVKNSSGKADEPRNLCLPGRLGEGFVIRQGVNHFLLLSLLKNQYYAPNSNAQRVLTHRFIVQLPSANCWCDTENQDGPSFPEPWRPQNSTTPGTVPDEVRKYAELQAQLASIHARQREAWRPAPFTKRGRRRSWKDWLNRVAAVFLLFLVLLSWPFRLMKETLVRHRLTKRIERIMNILEVAALDPTKQLYFTDRQTGNKEEPQQSLGGDA